MSTRKKKATDEDKKIPRSSLVNLRSDDVSDSVITSPPADGMRDETGLWMLLMLRMDVEMAQPPPTQDPIDAAKPNTQ